MARYVGKDGIDNPILSEWERVVHNCNKHPRRVRRRAYRTYKNWPALLYHYMTSFTGWLIFLSIIGAVVYFHVFQKDKIGWTFQGGFSCGEYFWTMSYFLWAFAIWGGVLGYLVDVGCERRYRNYCKEKFIWPADISYYKAYIEDDGQLSIEEWKPVRYAYHLYTTQSTMRHPFKVWYRNQCKRVANLDKYCKLRNHLIC